MQSNYPAPLPSTDTVYTQLPSTDDDPSQQQTQSHGHKIPDIMFSATKSSKHDSSTFNYPPTVLPAARLLRSSRSGIIRNLGKTFLAIILSAGLPLAFFLYIFTNRTLWTTSTLQTTVPLGNVLLLFSILSKLVITSIPLVMSITAFHVADAWLRRQKRGQTGAGVSPYQYNLILDVYTGASIFSAWRTLQYLVRSVIPSSPSATQSQSKVRHGRRSLSYVLETSIITLVILLVMAYTITGVDFALHHLSTPVLVPRQLDVGDPKAISYGRQLKSECLLRNSESGSPCTIVYEFLSRDHSVHLPSDDAYINDYPEALKTLSGTSDTNQIVVANDVEYQIASLVPATQAFTSGSFFEAKTIGLHAACEPVTPKCKFDSKRLQKSIAFNCSIDGYDYIHGSIYATYPTGMTMGYFPDYELPTWLDQPSPFIEAQGSNGTDINPYVFMFVGSLYTRSNIADPDGVWNHDPRFRTSNIILMCKATVVDVNFRYEAITNSYSILSSTPSTNNATIRAVTAVLQVIQSPLDDLVSALQPIVLSVSTTDEFVRAFEVQYAKTYLPFAQSAFEPIPATRADVSDIVQGSSIPTPWLLVYIALVMLFGLFALLQGLLALRVDKTSVWRPDIAKSVDQRRDGFETPSSSGAWVNVTQLATERLVGPTALVSEAFERPDGDADNQIYSLQLDELDMFREGKKEGASSCTIGVGFENERDLERRKGGNMFSLVTVPPSRDFNLSQTTIVAEESRTRESPRYS
ncbi:hypothetical protein FRC18_012251 [Serendipita sp. 400]|nr:hypothetical protein FRC18_012251 [Serendipita sp. 400]